MQTVVAMEKRLKGLKGDEHKNDRKVLKDRIAAVKDQAAEELEQLRELFKGHLEAMHETKEKLSELKHLEKLTPKLEAQLDNTIRVQISQAQIKLEKILRIEARVFGTKAEQLDKMREAALEQVDEALVVAEFDEDTDAGAGDEGGTE